MIRARIGNEDIYCFENNINNYSKEELKTWAAKGLLKCPACGKNLEYCHGKIINPYFRHKDKTECDLYGEPETNEHIAGKQLLYNWISKQDGVSNVVLEGYLPSTHQRPDIMFQYKDETYVIEFQCSPISTEYKERHRLYKAAGIIDFWVLGMSKYNTQSCRKFLEQEIGVFLNVNNSTLTMLEQSIKRYLKYGYVNIISNRINININHSVFSEYNLFNINDSISSTLSLDKDLYKKYSPVIESNNIVNWSNDSLKVLINRINYNESRYGHSIQIVNGYSGIYFLYYIGAKKYYLFFNDNHVRVSRPKAGCKNYWDCLRTIQYDKKKNKKGLTYEDITNLIKVSKEICDNSHEQDKEELRLLREEERCAQEQEKLKEEKRMLQLKKINDIYEPVYDKYIEYLDKWFIAQRDKIQEFFNNINYEIFDSFNCLSKKVERKTIDVCQELLIVIDLQLKGRIKSDLKTFVENKFYADIYDSNSIIKISSPHWKFEKFNDASCQEKFIENFCRILKKSQRAFVYWERNNRLPDIKLYSELSFDSWYDFFKCLKGKYMDFKIKLFMNWNTNQAFMSVHDRESIFNNQKSIFSRKNDDGYVMIPINKESFTNETLNYCRQVLRNTIIE